MKRAFVVCLAALLVPTASIASDRVLLRREYYYNSNPEILRVVDEISERRDRELGEISQEVDTGGPAYWEAWTLCPLTTAVAAILRTGANEIKHLGLDSESTQHTRGKVCRLHSEQGAMQVGMR